LHDECPSDFLYGSFIFEVDTGFMGIIGAVEIFNDGFFLLLIGDRIGESGARIELALRLDFGVEDDELFLFILVSISSLFSFCLFGNVERFTEISCGKRFTNFNNNWTGISLWSGLLGINCCINIFGI